MSQSKRNRRSYRSDSPMVPPLRSGVRIEARADDERAGRSIGVLRQAARRRGGAAGPAGSGKSTTLAAMLEHINVNRPVHLITIEDPIEYVFESKLALVHQRELGQDTSSFSNGLKYALRQDPDDHLEGACF